MFERHLCQQATHTSTLGRHGEALDEAVVVHAVASQAAKRRMQVERTLKPMRREPQGGSCGHNVSVIHHDTQTSEVFINHSVTVEQT